MDLLVDDHRGPVRDGGTDQTGQQAPEEGAVARGIFRGAPSKGSPGAYQFFGRAAAVVARVGVVLRLL